MAGDHAKQHPYHLVNPSPWPALASLSALLPALGGAGAMHAHAFGIPTLVIGFAILLYTMYVWWRDVVNEAEHDHAHTAPVSRGLRAGMVLFIVSEVMFFVAFFWAFFHASTLPIKPLADTWEMAKGVWPPEGIITFDPWHLPFLNSLILLLSGTTVNLAHYALLEDNRRDFVRLLGVTVVLGLIFTGLQAFEYSHAAFGFKDTVYASNFYLATGFHGFHVIVGTVFLAVCWARARRGHFTPKQHLGFEFAAWYWHFVDVVWLFLFVCIYGELVNKLLPAFEAIFTATHIAIAAVVLVVAGLGYATWKLTRKTPHAA